MNLLSVGFALGLQQIALSVFIIKGLTFKILFFFFLREKSCSLGKMNYFFSWVSIIQYVVF